MTKKQILRSVAFVLVACLMMAGLCDLFELENNKNYAKRAVTYRALEKNTVDAVIVGTSGIDRYWIGSKAYEEYGMTVYPYSSDAMPSCLYKNVVEEIYTHQTPELVVVDVRAFTQSNRVVNNNSSLEVRARRILDAMPLWSVNYIKTAIASMKYIQSASEEKKGLDWKVSLFLSFFKYHTKWADEDFSFEDNLGDIEHEYLGYFVNSRYLIRRREQKPTAYDPNNYEELDSMAESSLYDFLGYAKEKNMNVLFLDTPKFKSKKELGRTNTVKKIVKENGFAYLDFYTTQKDGSFSIDLNPKEDFYDGDHTNYYGAEKFTGYFAAYLQENYDFEDHRNDDKVKKDWDGVYQKIKDAVNNLENGKALDGTPEEAEEA